MATQGLDRPPLVATRKRLPQALQAVWPSRPRLVGRYPARLTSIIGKRPDDCRGSATVDAVAPREMTASRPPGEERCGSRRFQAVRSGIERASTARRFAPSPRRSYRAVVEASA